MKENKFDLHTAGMLIFLSKDFDYVLNNLMNVRESLGWSRTFMKCGIAAFMILLCKTDDLPKGMDIMAYMISSFLEHYSNYTEIANALIEWKKTVIITDEKKKYYLSKMEKFVEIRVEGIMNGNHRKYYNECAAFIGALGEVEESLGIVDSKQVIMEQYRSKYSRRRAFHESLKNCGMIRR